MLDRIGALTLGSSRRLILSVGAMSVGVVCMDEAVAYRVEGAHRILSDECCGYRVLIYVRSRSALDIAKLLRYQGQAEFNGSPEQE